MSKQDEKQLNQDKELAQLRSMVDGVQGDDYALDDILAEYSDRKTPGVVAMSPEEDEELLLFPSILPDPPLPPEPEEDEEIEEDEPEFNGPVLIEPDRDEDEQDIPDEEDGDPAETEEDPAPPDNVIAFPQQESPLSALIHGLSRNHAAHSCFFCKNRHGFGSICSLLAYRITHYFKGII